MLNSLEYSHPHATVRAAHGLADLLKKRHPEQREQVDELQHIVTRAHQRLDELQRELDDVELAARSNGGKPIVFSQLCGQVADQINTLNSAYQALDDLRRRAPKPQLPSKSNTRGRVALSARQVAQVARYSTAMRH